ncbi:nuclear transport factor 2 family protein [Terrarubrum flagellatum]|uniref:nuclear transport factor 2 family protein n=1 Tax=Terrirubrum flagellatum TaxID=2895980 RepID=UPI003144DB4B
MNADIEALRAATQIYFDGVYEGDVDKLASVFHPTSALTNVGDDGSINIRPRAVWLDFMGSRPSAMKNGLTRGDEILSIDVTGDMALVKVKCQIPPRYFTDLLSFLKVDGKWQIVQKVFTTEMRA